MATPRANQHAPVSPSTAQTNYQNVSSNLHVLSCSLADVVVQMSFVLSNTSSTSSSSHTTQIAISTSCLDVFAPYASGSNAPRPSTPCSSALGPSTPHLSASGLSTLSSAIPRPSASRSNIPGPSTVHNVAPALLHFVTVPGHLLVHHGGQSSSPIAHGGNFLVSV